MSQPDDPAWNRLHLRFQQRLEREYPLLCAYRQPLTAPLTDDARQALHRLAHGLAGIGGIFGCPEISTAASALEDGIIRGYGTDELDAVLLVLIDAVADALKDGCGLPSRA